MSAADQERAMAPGYDPRLDGAPAKGIAFGAALGALLWLASVAGAVLALRGCR